MGKKNKPNIIVYEGKFIDIPSIIEIRNELSEDEWKSIIGQTADFFMQMEAANKSSRLDKHDLRIMRQLKKTLEIIKNLDPILYSLYINHEKQEQYEKIAKEAESKLQIGFGDKLDGRSDIIVSKLD